MSETCSISGCGKPAKTRAFWETKDTGEKVIDLRLCEEHGEKIQKTYFPTHTPEKTG